MSTLEKIKELLDKNEIQYKEFHHEPVRTSEEAQRKRPEYSLSQGAKAIIISAKFTGGERKFIMIVIPANERIDSAKTRKILLCKKFSFAKESEVVEVTQGVEPGGVPPFGNLFDIDVYVDQTLRDNNEIIFNAGDRSVSIVMNYKDWEKIVKPAIVDIIEQ
jgi:Ala-tRNA(Pro) deacylase